MAAGVSTQSFAASSTPPTGDRKLRVAMIGVGAISDIHLRTLRAFPDVELVAATHPRRERLDWARDTHGISALFTDWRDMLQQIKPDAVNVCTPNALHAPAVIDALNAGAHAITEKPMAGSVAECEAMVEAARRNKKKLAVGFQYRFHPATRFLAQARDEGAFGPVLFVKCQALRRRGIPNWGVFGQKEKQGGGPLIDIGVHVLEMAHYVMGSPQPIAASGSIWTYLGNKPSTIASRWPHWDHASYTVEDLAVGQIRFANGALLQIESSFAAHIEKDLWNFTLMGETGGCTWDPPALFTDRAGHMTNTVPAYLGDGSFDALFVRKLRNWVDACLYNTPLEAPGEAGLTLQKMLDALYRSAAAGHEVPITPPEAKSE